MVSTGETEASNAGVRLARDSRLGVRRMIASGGEAFHEGGITFRPHPSFRAFPHAFLKRIHPTAGVLKAPALILLFRLNQDTNAEAIRNAIDKLSADNSFFVVPDGGPMSPAN